MPANKKSMKKGNLLQSIVVHALLIIGAIAFMFPLYWMVVTALKTLPEVLQSPPLWFPKKLLWSNFKTAINIIPFWTYTMNTVIVCVLSVIGTLISSTLVAYAFSRLQWKGREFTFKCVLATMMIPFPVLMVPLFVLFSKIGWVGSLKPLWAPTFFASAFNIFLLRQFFMTIPMELSEAARIDGCSEFGILVRIILPLSKPVLLVVALFQFIYSWNDFLAPLIYLTRQETFTLSLGLQFYQSQQGGSQWNYLMAAATLVVLPVLVLYFIAQRYFIEGISLTGVKG